MALRLISPPRLCAVMIAALAILPSLASGQTNAIKLIKGTITNAATGKSIDGGRLLVYEGTSTEPTTKSKINPGTGAYQVILSPSTTYRFEVASPRFYATSFTVTTPGGANYEETVKDLKVEPIAIGSSLYSGHLFEPGTSKLTETTDLRKTVDMLKKERAVVVAVTVIPDMPAAGAAKKAPAPKKGKKGQPAPPPAPTPAPTDNAAQLGDARVAVLKTFFKQQGISTTRLTWDVKSPVTVTAKKGKGAAQYPDNVMIKIASIQEDESDS
jgi:hypothetical protein